MTLAHFFVYSFLVYSLTEVVIKNGRRHSGWLLFVQPGLKGHHHIGRIEIRIAVPVAFFIC